MQRLPYLRGVIQPLGHYQTVLGQAQIPLLLHLPGQLQQPPGYCLPAGLVFAQVPVQKQIAGIHLLQLPVLAGALQQGAPLVQQQLQLKLVDTPLAAGLQLVTGDAQHRALGPALAGRIDGLQRLLPEILPRQLIGRLDLLLGVEIGVLFRHLQPFAQHGVVGVETGLALQGGQGVAILILLQPLPDLGRPDLAGPLQVAAADGEQGHQQQRGENPHPARRRVSRVSICWYMWRCSSATTSSTR